MPRTTRISLWLLSIALALDVITVVWYSGVTGYAFARVAVRLCLFGGLLFAIAYRRNWARLTFAFLFVVGVFYIVLQMRITHSYAPFDVAVVVCVAALQVAGLIYLFLPESSAWYHAGGRAA